MKLFSLLTVCCLVATSVLPVSAQKNVELETLQYLQKTNGFTAMAVYLNAAGQAMGARFVHDRTGFTFDLLQIESAPQTFIWVNSLPVSDKGEPHTQEHLLITKGNKGHELNTREGMSLAVSNAFTSQVFTAYDFYTNGGADVFFKLFEEYMDALLHPDYTDEEVHREVRNWGIAEDAATKQLRLEEKGSVYNEMKTSMNNVYSQVYNSIQRMIYGNAHPLALNAGGLPEGIRTLGAADITKFHDNNYHLNNMGAISALPKTMRPAVVLASMNLILNRLQPGNNEKIVVNTLPDPTPAISEKSVIVNYPSANEQEPGLMMFAYPAALSLDPQQYLMLSVFLNTFAGDASTNLYKLFIDGKKRKLDLDVQGVFGYADNHKGQLVFIGLDNISAASLSKEKAIAVWQLIQQELKTIASFPAGSPALVEFNNRFKNNLTDYQRVLSKFTNTPPLFGGRNTGDAWYQQLAEMEKLQGFRKSIILVPQFKSIDSLLITGKNFWGGFFENWKLFNNQPFTVMGKANAQLLQQQDSAAKIRAADEVKMLRVKYNTTDDQEAIKKYRASYDSATVTLEKAEAAHTTAFIDNPPLTLDDQLNFSASTTGNNIPFVASTFNNMTGATTGIALQLNKLPETSLIYLAMLPELLTQTGLFKNGRGISFEEMSQLQRQQILSLTSYYNSNARTRRSELIVKSAGNNAGESAKAIEWINDVLQYPWLKKENLPRIRDLVDQTLGTLRKTMQGAEESWVNDPGYAYRVQNNKLVLATASFLTRMHNVQRLRWMLMDAGTEPDRAQALAFFDLLAGEKGSREDLKKLLTGLRIPADTTKPNTISTRLSSVYQHLSGKAKKTIQEAAKDLEQTLNDLPDGSLAADWQFLCNEMKADFSVTSEKTLIDLDNVRKNILHTGNARIFMIGSGAVQLSLKTNLAMLVSCLSTDKQEPVIYAAGNAIEARYHQRTGTKDHIVFAGLVNQNTTTGVFINSFPLVTYSDTSREKLLQLLAAELFAGGSKQSIYTKTTGAGLSYSTGAGASPSSGLMTYYAERTPLLPQTLGFVIDEIKKTPDDPVLREYVIALSLSASREAGEYEMRGEAMAADLADGVTPDTVSNFRKAILRLRKDPLLMTQVYKRKDQVYEKILPGYGSKMRDVPGGSYFVIGPEKQLQAYESYLQSREDRQSTVARLYPRDFWMIEK